MKPRIRQVDPSEWARLKALRLAALADAPSAFGRSFAETVEYPDQLWTEMAPDVFVVDDGGAWHAMAGVHGIDNHPTSRGIWGMWVDPSQRRAGHAVRLIEHISAWALSAGADRLHLWVTETNEGARRMYADLGFAPTGQSRPLPSDPSFTIIAMDKRIAP